MTESKRVDELADFYRSPSPNHVVAWLENKMLSADDSWWTGRDPFHMRVVAEVPRAVYLNFLAPKSYVAALAPHLFRPLDLPGDNTRTLWKNSPRYGQVGCRCERENSLVSSKCSTARKFELN